MALSRLVGRTFKRQFATAGVHGETSSSEAGKSALLWKRMFIFVAIPAIALANVQVYLKHKNEHWERPEFVPYSCVRVRTKRYPWGDGTKTLFHNSHRNALPSGWEEIDH